MRYPMEVRIIQGLKKPNARRSPTLPISEESTDEIIGLAEGLGYCKNQRHSFDDSQENELQLCLHGALNTNLGSLDF